MEIKHLLKGIKFTQNTKYKNENRKSAEKIKKNTRTRTRTKRIRISRTVREKQKR